MIVTALRDVAAKFPDRPAVIDGDRTVTFAEFQREIDRRAAALLAAGLQAGNRVALVAESSVDYLATAMAVWSADGVLVTIYPSSGSDDLEYALANSEPALVVVGAKQEGAVAGFLSGTPWCLVEDFKPASVRANTLPNPENLREPLSLICYSSGTTSRPKAIMVSAHAVFNTADTYGEVWHFGPEDRGIVCLPMAWMYGLASTSLALLLRGAAAIVVSRARPELLATAIRDHRATFLAGVTTTFAKLLQYAEELALDASTFESLRLCISGGEPRNEGAFQRWFSFSGVAVLDAYCSSECLPVVTYDPLVDPVPKPGSAGKLVPRAKLRIVDPKGAEVAAGDVGEALTGGPGLMLGYWRDDTLTAEAMTDNAWFRTKDLVRMDEDGYVYVVGRLSDLIIRGGVNISPGEIERVIREHQDVADVAVVGVPDDIYGERVLAAVVPRGNLDLEALKAAVAATLTAYKVPSEYAVVESIPVNSTTGKVDRRSLVTQLQKKESVR